MLSLEEGKVSFLSSLDVDANRTSSLVIRPDGPVPETDARSTASSRASFLVAGEALTFGVTEINPAFSLKLERFYIN